MGDAGNEPPDEDLRAQVESAFDDVRRERAGDALDRAIGDEHELERLQGEAIAAIPQDRRAEVTALFDELDSKSQPVARECIQAAGGGINEVWAARQQADHIAADPQGELDRRERADADRRSEDLLAPKTPPRFVGSREEQVEGIRRDAVFVSEWLGRYESLLAGKP